MEQFIGCDAHKKYSVFVAVNERGEASPAIRVGHDREQYRQFLERLPAGSQIALEAGGHYYWMVDEMEAAGHRPRLVHPLEAKKRMGKTGKKTDKVDANGLGILLRNGTLPEVWIPPSELRDQRESLRLRMFLVQQRTRLKNRIQGALARYNIQMAEVSDMFGVEGRLRLGKRLAELPEHTRQSVELELVTLDFLEVQLADIEKRLEALMKVTAEADLLKTLPYVGRILSMVMTLEIGKVERFASAAHLASYAGLVPRVHASGGTYPARADLRGCESLLEVGLYRSREPGGDPSKASGWSARSAAVSTGQAQEEPPESGCGRCPALSRSRLLDFEETGSLSRPAAEAEGPGPSAGCACSFVDARVSAEPAIALLRLMIDCDTRSRDWLLQKLKADIWLPTKKRKQRNERS